MKVIVVNIEIAPERRMNPEAQRSLKAASQSLGHAQLSSRGLFALDVGEGAVLSLEPQE